MSNGSQGGSDEPPFELEIEALASGNGYYCRLRGKLGSVGWSPFPWTVTYGRTMEEARAKFYERHKAAMVRAKLEGKL